MRVERVRRLEEEPSDSSRIRRRARTLPVARILSKVSPEVARRSVTDFLKPA